MSWGQPGLHIETLLQKEKEKEKGEEKKGGERRKEEGEERKRGEEGREKQEEEGEDERKRRRRRRIRARAKCCAVETERSEEAASIADLGSGGADCKSRKGCGWPLAAGRCRRWIPP